MQITRLKRILVLGLLAPGLAHALGLGDITVRSYLNEPLKAEIPLRVDGATEVDDLRLRVASQAYFDRFGIVRSTLHDRMRFEIDERERVWVIRVSSREVVSEPYLSFPLEALWRGGELIREYTLFIDPRPQPRAAEVEGSPVRPTQPQTVPPPPTRVAAGASYGPVKRGETLWPIAKRLQPRGVSTEQMMMALLRANPTAFRAGNVNNLRAGAVLQVPSADEINRRSRRQARQAFRQQTAAWRGGGVAQRTKPSTPTMFEPVVVEPAPVPPREQESELRILGKASEQSPRAATQKPVDTTSDVEKRVLLTLENTAATRLEFADLRKQVLQMQEQMNRMRQLLLLKEQQIAALQATRAKPVAPPPLAVESPADQSATRPFGPEPRPIAIEQPVRSPVANAADFLQQWWFVLIAALLATLGILLGLLVARRVYSDDTAHSIPARVPYAEEVARYGGAEAAAASAQPAEVAVRREPQPRVAAPPTPIAAAAPQVPVRAPTGVAAQTQAYAGPDDALDIGYLGVGSAGGANDDEIESWVRDLESELERDRADADLNDVGLPSLREKGGDMDLDIRLDVDPLEGLTGPNEDEEFEVASVMRELLVDPELDLQAEVDGVDVASDGSDADPEAIDLKLELARAYLEIGDIEGARDILREVVDGALSVEQKEEARMLLAALR